jgi:hypothetical protein
VGLGSQGKNARKMCGVRAVWGSWMATRMKGTEGTRNRGNQGAFGGLRGFGSVLLRFLMNIDVLFV